MCVCGIGLLYAMRCVRAGVWLLRSELDMILCVYSRCICNAACRSCLIVCAVSAGGPGRACIWARMELDRAAVANRFIRFDWERKQ